METIFDIFGSRDSVKPSNLNPLSQRLTMTKGVSSSEGVLPGKQSIKNEGPTLKGKKVLGDVGNRIKGLNLKTESNSNDSTKKPLPGSSHAPSISCPSTKVTDTLEENVFQKKPLTSRLIWEDCADFNNVDKWPETETQGPSFWSNDDYESTWPDIDCPSIQNFCCAANIWDFGMKDSEEHPQSPMSREITDEFQFCLDLPSTHDSEMVLEEPEVKFPWEI